jgi:hypothetical protein
MPRLTIFRPSFETEPEDPESYGAGMLEGGDVVCFPEYFDGESL